ncbi:MAG: hypothetical protein ACTSYI_02235 [Promethearchaeota archaeon]
MAENNNNPPEPSQNDNSPISEAPQPKNNPVSKAPQPENKQVSVATQPENNSVSKAPQPENKPVSKTTLSEIPIEQTIEKPEIEKLDQQKRDLPKNPVELLKLTKSGSITLPKSIREKLDEKQAFAFWLENDRYMLMPVKEYEIPDLKLAADIQREKKRRASESRGTDASGSKTKRKPRSKSKTKAKTQSTSGLQPELSRYFPYSIENQEKLQDGIEASFYKLLETPPKMDEVIERIKYMIINYGTGKKTNDSRLKHTIILFVIDAVEKIRDHDLTPLLHYLDEKIVGLIESAYLYEQSLIFLCGTALKIDENQLAFSFLKKIFKVIDGYKENFTIMQGLKSITKTVIQADKPLTEEFQLYLHKNLKKYVIGPELIEESEEIELSDEMEQIEPDEERELNEAMETSELGEEQEQNEAMDQVELDVPEEQNIFHYPLNTDSSLEIVELLEDLQMFDGAYDSAKSLLERIEVEDVHVESVRAKVNALAKK